ncbi:MAG: dethiobiotin synthase [Bradymonadaceae bacterium]
MSQTPIIIVTGTDTEIGKTLVTCALADRFRRRGIDVRAVKPVESGLDELEPQQTDGARLARAADQQGPERALTELSRPLAPPEAADIDGVELWFDDWCRHIETIADDADLVFVEGAGGLLSPLTWEHTARELAAALGAPALVVAPDALGVLNHTLMTVEVLDGADIPLLGVVFSRARDADASTDKNPHTFRRVSGIDRVTSLPTVDGPETASRHLTEVADWIEASLEVPEPGGDR